MANLLSSIASLGLRNNMRSVLTFLFGLSTILVYGSAFAPRVQSSQFGISTSSSSSSQLHLFDFFLSEEERRIKAEQKQKIIEEQEALQREILERWRNPEMMKEYESRVSVRRKAFEDGLDGNEVVAKMGKTVNGE
jgi:hypothetical protein